MNSPCAFQHAKVVPAALIALLTVAGGAMACGTAVDEIEEGVVIATVNTFELADSSLADSILVHLAGIIGETTAYKFDHIDTTRTNSVFRIVVWGTWKRSSNETYQSALISFDTLLVLTSPLQGLHVVEVLSGTTTLRDSTIVY